jgi:hypothetical protein
MFELAAEVDPKFGSRFVLTSLCYTGGVPENLPEPFLHRPNLQRQYLFERSEKLLPVLAGRTKPNPIPSRRDGGAGTSTGDLRRRQNERISSLRMLGWGSPSPTARQDGRPASCSLAPRWEPRRRAPVPAVLRCIMPATKSVRTCFETSTPIPATASASVKCASPDFHTRAR